MLSISALKAQTVYDRYIEFNGDITIDNRKDKALEVAGKILNSTERLPAKTQTNFHAKLAKLYEGKSMPDSAIKYWGKVIDAEPDYYVAHRAIAYLQLQQSNGLITKINASRHDAKAYATYSGEYKKIVKNCLYHLEKAQACDPDETSLNYIKRLYGSNDPAGLTTLDARLKTMIGHCVDLLTD